MSRLGSILLHSELALHRSHGRRRGSLRKAGKLVYFKLPAQDSILLQCIGAGPHCFPGWSFRHGLLAKKPRSAGFVSCRCQSLLSAETRGKILLEVGPHPALRNPLMISYNKGVAWLFTTSNNKVSQYCTSIHYHEFMKPVVDFVEKPAAVLLEWLPERCYVGLFVRENT